MKKPQVLDEYFDSVLGVEDELLDEAALSGIRGLPSKDNREMVVRFKVGSANIPTGNRRYYPLETMKREVGLLQEKLEKRQLFCNDQHPRRTVDATTGKVDYVDQPKWGSQCFIPFTLEINEQGEIFSSGVIPKTDSGKNLAAVIRGGGRPGVSIRGHGTTEKKKIKVGDEEQELDVVKENYKLKTFDVVLDQSVSDAGILALSESHPIEASESETEVVMAKNLKFADWVTTHPEAHKALTEGFKEGSIGLDDVKSMAPLYEALRNEVAEELETEVQQKLLDGYEQYLESIREDITKEELEEAQAEGIALFCSELGLDGDHVRAIVEHKEEFGEFFRTSIEEMLNPSEETSSTEENPEGTVTQENLEETMSQVVKNDPSVTALQEQLNRVQTQLTESLKTGLIAELKAVFPYDSTVFGKHIQPLLESADDVEEVQSLYESQVALLKAAGSKETPRGSARFLNSVARDSQEGELQENQEQRGPTSLDEELIGAAADDMAASIDG